MTDLIERLRSMGQDTHRGWGPAYIDRAGADMLRAANRITTLEAEAHENTRLLGMGGEREANLHGEVTRLKKALARAEAEASEGERLRALLADIHRTSPKPFRLDRPGLTHGQAAEIGYGALRDAIQTRVVVALIPEAPTREGWQPIETAPRGDPLRSILIATRGYVGGVVQVSWSDTHQDFVDLDEDTYPDATYWRPLPPPPSQDREPDSQRGAK